MNKKKLCKIITLDKAFHFWHNGEALKMIYNFGEFIDLLKNNGWRII